MALDAERVQPRSSGRQPAAAPADQRTGGRRRKPTGGGAGLLTRSTPYLLLLPAVLATVALLGYPLLKNLLLSFQNLNMRQFIQHLTEWNGAENYQAVLSSSEFWHTALRSLVFTLANVALIMVGGTLVGLLLNRLGKGMRLLLSIGLILAWAMPIVASTTVFTWLFDSQYGVVNWFLDKLGWHSMAEYNWMSTQLSAFSVITLLIVWGSIPFVAFNMYAGLTTIPKELYEAARMDGAGAGRIFTQLTFPVLKPFFLSTTFLEVIWVFKAFTQVFAIAGGGPERSTETLPVYAYIEGFGNQHFGMGAAISMLTILILLVVMAYYFRIIVKQEDEL
ncbi:carbohydrate ABC transporter permease [Peterkaempfera bronchialis]|uniref:Sugar ABC transporter permease n=1 Tax=Peterkaempfera bronchialis TaxID=2126346 RepID=A0A345T081_9ACTN|nr:sugar ABC transporter permease [Peterkaempfera bronchialis]AXI79386.1 sugar ABC transporter permease [Peterkaempfera bronchialis]